MLYPTLYSNNTDAYQAFMFNYFASFGMDNMNSYSAQRYGVRTDPTIIVSDGMGGNEVARLEGSKVNASAVQTLVNNYGVTSLDDPFNVAGSGQAGNSNQTGVLGGQSGGQGQGTQSNSDNSSNIGDSAFEPSKYGVSAPFNNNFLDEKIDSLIEWLEDFLPCKDWESCKIWVTIILIILALVIAFVIYKVVLD
jgi:hypothetical protein